MTAVNSILRAIILFSLAVVTFVTLFSIPSDSSAHFYFDLLMPKAICIVTGYALYRLYPLWCETDKWIGRFDKWLERNANK